MKTRLRLEGCRPRHLSVCSFEQAAELLPAQSGAAAAARHFPQERTFHTGTPVRPGLVQALQGATHRRREAGQPLQLLVFGGSQGGRELNELMIGAAPLLARRHDALAVRHITGARDLSRVQQAYREAGLRARTDPFVDDIGGAYRTADLCICQAGASTCAELALAGLPALLIPFSRATDDHQAANAAELARHGAAWTIRHAELTPAGLARFVLDQVDDRTPLVERGQRALELARPEAAMAVVRLLEEAGREHA